MFKKGFTLIELTVSIGVLALVIGVTGGVLVSVVNAYQKQRVVAEIERNGDFVTRTLEEALKSAVSLSCVNATGTTIPCTGSADKILQIGYVGSTKYFGWGMDNSYSCNTASTINCYMFFGEISNFTTPTPTSIRITNAAENGVDIANFDVSVFGTGATSDPLVVTATIDITGPKNTSWVNERRSFNSFLTVRSSY